MPFIHLLVPLSLASVSLSSQSVPAHGRQNVTLTIDRAGMFHVSAEGTAGTTCELIDHLRGPFFTSGVLGEQNCDGDLLLDSGTYQVRLASPRKGKGQVALHVTPFVEITPKPVVLTYGTESEGALQPGQQASFWIHQEEAGPVTLRVAGRTAGAVHLWQDGEWLRESDWKHFQPEPRPGAPIHEWWLSTQLEAGAYLVTVYGTEALAWSGDKRDADSLAVAAGFVAAPKTQYLTAALPRSGILAVALPAGGVAAVLSRQGVAPNDTTLGLLHLSSDGVVQIGEPEATCAIASKALIPECEVHSLANDAHVLVVRGLPGLSVQVLWASYTEDASLTDNSYGPVKSQITFRVPKSGTYLLATHDVPPNRDEPPLGCLVSHPEKVGSTLLGTDGVSISNGKSFVRSFNYDGNHAVLWFRATQPGLYKFEASGERKSHCQLFGFDGDERKLLEDAPSCSESKFLGGGVYELDLEGGTEGIEKLRIASILKGFGGASGAEETSTKASCQIQQVSLAENEPYHLTLSRSGGASARGLFLRELPLKLDRVLPVDLEPKETFEVPVGPGQAIEARSLEGGAFRCQLGRKGGDAVIEARDGVCRLPASSELGKLTLTSESDGPLALLVARPEPPPRAAVPQSYTPKPRHPPVLELDHRQFVDFGREQQRSLVFTVAEAGLYRFATEGLLATQCSLRTPVFPSLASDSSGGRGRNCLLETYLRPGRYLVTAETQGKSRGRAGLSLTRQPAHELQSVTADGEAFFREPPGELVLQKFTVKKGGHYRLSTTAHGAPLRCRLEDSEGWPLVAVPTACVNRFALDKGTYLWSQLPLTVESQRHTQLARVKPPLILKGSKPHPVELNTSYDVFLSKRGTDRFRFSLQADLPVDVALDNGMQGRLYRLAKDGTREPVAVIAPNEEKAASSNEGQGEDGEYSEKPPSGEDGEESESPAPEPSEEGDEGYTPPPSDDETPHHAKKPDQPPPETLQPSSGGLALERGDYELVAVHHRGDVGIRYRLQVSSDTLAPGITKEVPVPSRQRLRVPSSGTLRFSTEGEADVRCRLFDSAGRLVLESNGHGDDWNCSAAELLGAGDYELALESQTLSPGTTKLIVSAPPPKDVGALTDGATLAVGAEVVVAGIPAASGDTVQEVVLSSKRPFSCAIEDSDGTLLARLAEVKLCPWLVHAPGAHRVRVWTLGSSAQVRVSLRARPTQDGSGKLTGETIRRHNVAEPGRYRTGPGVWCLPDSEPGLFRWCDSEVSLEAGPTLFAVLGTAPSTPLSLDPVPASLEATATSGWVPGSDRPFIQRQTSRTSAVHLLALTALPGERRAPRCGLEGGARTFTPRGCFAASGLTKGSVARWSIPAESSSPMLVARRALTAPEASPLVLGNQHATWTGETGRYRLPAPPWRASVTLAPESWAVQLDENEQAVDLCAPAEGLSDCVLTGKGGTLVLVGAEGGADVELALGDRPPAAIALDGRYEDGPGASGTQRFSVARASMERGLEVAGAARCVLALEDGTRLRGCAGQIPAGVGGELLVERSSSGLRAILFGSEGAAAIRFGPLLGLASRGTIPASQDFSLAAQGTEGTFTLAREQLVHLRAETGVCALAQGPRLVATDGLDRGCDFWKLLPAGDYRVLVRPFAQRTLSGQARWSGETLEALADGVGTERWLRPGQQRMFAFQLASDGKVGFGLRAAADTLQCAILDEHQEPVGTGCQEFLQLPAGRYLVSIRDPADATPMRFRPVLLGLAGAKTEIPEEYLQNFFERVRGEQ